MIAASLAQRQQQQQQPSSRYLEAFRPARRIISANEKNGGVLSQLGMLDARPAATPWIDWSRRATSPAAELAAAATGRRDIDTLSRTAPIGPLDRRSRAVASYDP